MENRKTLQNHFFTISLLEYLCIIALAIVPLFLSFPFRINIFLSWEGAYRLSKGEIPYKDFGMPLGYMYWVIPAIFFKIFGTQLISLVKAQVFINIISGIAFRSILIHLNIDRGIRFLGVVLYCISFSFFNFWPWYNHTVIVYEMVGLAFLTRYIFYVQTNRNIIWLILSAIFIFFSFFTKQDCGGLAFILCLLLLVVNCFYEKKWKPIIYFVISFVITGFIFIYPLTKYNFGYWFNRGQPPHTSRISVFDILDEFLMNSQWIKFYLFFILLLIIRHLNNWKNIISEKKETIFLLLTLGILFEASILQVTSYVPPDNNIFFHSFAFVYLLSQLNSILKLNFTRKKVLFLCLFGMLLWWSGIFWKYSESLIKTAFHIHEQTKSNENIVNRHTYLINTDTTEIPVSQWISPPLKSFKNIYMPKPTVDGINRLLNYDIVKKNKNIRTLNMTELTPLAVEIPYKPETGSEIPLWYHLGVAMFNKEADQYSEKIKNKEYDLILFEFIPTLNNFYPFKILDTLNVYYRKIDSFPAPRRGETKGEIYIFKK